MCVYTNFGWHVHAHAAGGGLWTHHTHTYIYIYTADPIICIHTQLLIYVCHGGGACLHSSRGAPCGLSTHTHARTHTHIHIHTHIHTHTHTHMFIYICVRVCQWRGGVSALHTRDPLWPRHRHWGISQDARPLLWHCGTETLQNAAGGEGE